jgi:hypothetical protein
MFVIETRSSSHNDPHTAGVHERLSERGTHPIIQDILATGFLPKRPTGYATPRVEVSSSDIRTVLFPALKAAGLSLAYRIAHRAKKRAEDPNRGWGTVTLGAICTEVLLDSEVRRGAVPSQEGRGIRERLFSAALCREVPLQLAVLLFPVRDRNPAKNDGISPDLGEVEALVQLWTVTKALECARDQYVGERLEVIQRALAISHQSHSGLFGSLAQIIEQRSAPTSSGISATIDLAINLSRQKNERLTRRIADFGEELKVYAIYDQEKTAQLLVELARQNRTIDWLFQARDVRPEQPISILAIRDARRYPCFSSESESDIEHYKDELNRMHDVLQIGGGVILTSHEELEAQINPIELGKFRVHRETIYRGKKEKYLEIFQSKKQDLFKACSRTEFLNLLGAYESSGKIPAIFEAILHSKHHDSLLAWSSQFGVEASQHALHFLMTIYQPRCESQLELLRQELLWQTLAGAVEYVAAYESNSKGGNHLQLDDVELVAPGSIRLSIHQKPEYAGHFAVQVGASVHRTPWHGTAYVREDSQGKGYVLESRLALELKYEQAIPVFQDEMLGERSAPPQPGIIRQDDSIDSDNKQVRRIRREYGQPFFWLERNLARKLLEEDGLDGRGLIDKLSALGIRRS